MLCATDTNSGQPANTDTNSGQPANTDTNSGQPANTDTNSGQPANTDTNSGQPANTDTNSGQPANTDTNSGQPANTDTNSGQPANTDTNSGQPANTDTNSGQPANTDTNSGQPANTDTNSGQPANTDTNSGQPANTDTNSRVGFVFHSHSFGSRTHQFDHVKPAKRPPAASTKQPPPASKPLYLKDLCPKAIHNSGASKPSPQEVSKPVERADNPPEDRSESAVERSDGGNRADLQVYLVKDGPPVDRYTRESKEFSGFLEEIKMGRNVESNGWQMQEHYNLARQERKHVRDQLWMTENYFKLCKLEKAALEEKFQQDGASCLKERIDSYVSNTGPDRYGDRVDPRVLAGRGGGGSSRNNSGGRRDHPSNNSGGRKPWWA